MGVQRLRPLSKALILTLIICVREIRFGSNQTNYITRLWKLLS